MGKFRFNPNKFAKKKKLETNHIRRNEETQRKNIKNEDQTVINRENAKAPYNFVPLNKSVIEAEKVPDQNSYHLDRHTGYIDCILKTCTPIYVRDTLTLKEMDEKEKIEKDGDKRYTNPDFFSPGSRVRIPGSSLRGMVRTLIEIGSFGKFLPNSSFDDRRLYFRAVADTSRLGTEYKNIMVDEANNYYPKIKAGVLKYENQSYRIYPSKDIKGTGIYRIDFDKVNFKIDKFKYKIIYFEPVTPQNYSHTMPNGRKYQLKYALLSSVSQSKNAQHPNKGFIIASGEFGKKKHMHWVINEPGTNYIKIDENVIEEYRNDSSREAPDLLEALKQHHPDGVPCFYIIDGSNRVTSFGHTGMFRLAYKLTIGEHVLPELKDDSKIDIAEAIFGKEKLTKLFNWNEVPGNESTKFIELLKNVFGVTGVKTENIRKIDDGRVINVSAETVSPNQNEHIDSPLS